MSEYQYIAFRAIDAPVSGKNLEFMREQSSRAEVTAWSFDNEYHFGDFRGNASEMLRRGYDFHLHYADFGIRKLMIRLPTGLPNAKAAEAYFIEDGVEFDEDKQGPGGILSIEPFHEPGDFDDPGELDGLIDRLLPLRGEILDGDLRPLYLAYLAVASDGNHDPEEEKDAPVPAGLDKLTKPQRALAEFYGLSKAVISAAAKHGPPLAKHADSEKPYSTWLQNQPESIKNAWLTQLMTDPHSAVRSEILADFQKTHSAPAWPTKVVDRTIADILGAAEGIQRSNDRKEAAEVARRRAAKLAGMAADPAKTLRETEELVTQRNITDYAKIAKLLADLREALSGTGQSGLAEHQARKLKENNPTLHHLTAELRRQGFLKK
jgi:hypothetical protein